MWLLNVGGTRAGQLGNRLIERDAEGIEISDHLVRRARFQFEIRDHRNLLFTQSPVGAERSIKKRKIVVFRRLPQDRIPAGQHDDLPDTV